ncbi:uncharacterized protein K460DRAFT_272601 [Cucurbitaria berberidis CBS 394.84]|uniref:Uncharacterized protein n=1 Tax=Cucurbitaria berberidis CBS 394.84 TaxID=1168544 RepID=A0A9P4GV11_9PLEO|nr:uncharacterized protein K460DRAFT_272601 [Cucurbitaria berberidis CBS 394.84]KAF1851875.1 hypothetical protein K460DRAFT_272601 [Cucurbitaria berberidis CBS 394.84]
MQVHAVPDSERAFDSTGRKLPWAFEFADSDKNQRRMPEEKGPFGKARKRGTSRAKTPTTKSAADEAKLDNQRAIDDIFGRFRVDEDKRRSLSARPVAALPPSASAPNLIDAGGLATSFQASSAPTNGVIKEPKEVILYGYGTDAQWAAISHYERVSGGLVYEEYDREPYNPKSGYTFASQRSLHYKSLAKSALRKVNEFVGGDHWIKVTFDSAEAAERACHYSPKSIQGWTVYAEPYRGTGPTVGDKAIRAEAGGLSQTASPNTISSGTVGARDTSQSSTTVSSATATASIPASQGLLSRSVTEPMLLRASGAFPSHVDDLYAAPAPQAQTQLQPQASTNAASTALNPRSQRATLRLKGANVKPAVFLPQEKAFLPAPPRWQQTFGSLPIIGWVIGSGHGIIGDQVPRKEDGTFDENSASLYWRVWYMVDTCMGSDFCGVKDAEYDD